MYQQLLENKMSALSLKQLPQSASPVSQLQRWYMIVDGNQHRSDLCQLQPQFQAPYMLSEALIPQLRLVAILIAAQRLGFDQPTPDIISEEADWFAARILVMGVRVFHLDITLIPMLKTANSRARSFAQKHNLPFTQAQMRMSLHASRPEQMLIIETQTQCKEDKGWIQNSQHFAHNLCLTEDTILAACNRP
ncbi:hypothetical protein [Snodgrassella communis]|uniref:Uncharacterized protein n=1 Tax=Snodgrassella alvi TaxID=1196083 RepID=A0A2N9XSD9_9NEIS|nr:hypothetical protein [Snodgrassella communis]PIT51682.1 hypothetical protein BHC48_03115 [Snodgrassella communis]